MAKRVSARTFWIFKIIPNPVFRDEHGKTYGYHNRHSVRVKAGDLFVYLQKSGRYDFRFTGVGKIDRIEERPSTEDEQRRNPLVRRVFTAHLKDVRDFDTPIVISPTEEGRANRCRIGLSKNINDDGLSLSMCSIDELRFSNIVSLGGADLGTLSLLCS